MSEPSSSALKVFLPEHTLDYFVITHWSKNDDDVCITLEEKDDPPVSETDREKNIVSKGFHDITITDFPIRGRRALLTFRRRYWQIEGQKELLKREIPLCFPGTQLETEFAHFLKEASRRDSGVARLYRRVSMPPDQRI
jgi:hypothetical protein